MKLYIADAFTDTLFGGNPAGVVILEEDEEFPSDEVMLKTAAELRYSETAFVKPLSEFLFSTKYFTPSDEVDLCGHATIATFHCLMDAGIIKPGYDYTNKTLSGDLSIRVEESFIMMDMAPPRNIATIDKDKALKELYSVMGLKYEPVLVKDATNKFTRLLPMLISTGLPDIMMPVPSKEVLAAIRPDFSALTKLSKKYNAVGVHAFTLDNEDFEVTARCRNFAPLYGIDEEAATGTSNGALTYYLYCNGLILDNRDSVFIQGESMGRPSRILTHVKSSEKGKNVDIQVGGSAIVLAKGNIYL